MATNAPPAEQPRRAVPEHFGAMLQKAQERIQAGEARAVTKTKLVKEKEKAMTGVEVCRAMGISNMGPKCPTGGASARDHEVIPFKECKHDPCQNIHGGNRAAYYAQCMACKYHLEYYPKNQPGMAPVEEVMIVQAERKKKAASRAAREAKGSKAHGHPPTTPRTPLAGPNASVPSSPEASSDRWDMVPAEATHHHLPDQDAATEDAADPDPQMALLDMMAAMQRLVRGRMGRPGRG